jgi:hypothetical protein
MAQRDFGIQTDPRDLSNYIRTENARLRQQYLDEIRVLQGRLLALGSVSPFPNFPGYGFGSLSPRRRRRSYGTKRRSRRRYRRSPTQNYINARVPTARSRRCRNAKGNFIRCR